MFLGIALSGYASDDELNHAVNIIGWGPCLVPEADDDNLCGTDYSTMIIGECWIVQNSWYVKKKHLCKRYSTRYNAFPLSYYTPLFFIFVKCLW